MVAQSNFDDRNMRMSPVQRELLDRISAVELRSTDDFFTRSYDSGEKRISVIAKMLYQECPNLAEKSKQYNTKFSRDIHMRATYHWFKAMIEFRLNPYLMQSGQHVWQQENGELVRVAAMSEAVYTSVLGEVPLEQMQADETFATRVYARRYAPTAASGAGQPPKRQRLDEQGRSFQRTNSAADADLASSSQGTWQQVRPSSAPAATPKRRPES